MSTALAKTSLHTPRSKRSWALTRLATALGWALPLGLAVTLPALGAGEPPRPALITPGAQPACQASPLGKRELFLRGSFNNWAADEAQRFQYLCNHYELVATPGAGEASFKIADEAWSKDADLGGTLDALTPQGQALSYKFSGTHRFVLTMPHPSDHAPQANPAQPTLTISPCKPAPFGDTTLFLRGGMNNWGALDDYAFQYSCDAYYLNVALHQTLEFKIADAAWSPQTTFGHGATPVTASDGVAFALADARHANGLANLQHGFKGGEQTLRLSFDGPLGAPQLRIGPKSFADPRAASVTDPIALSVRFDSRQLPYKTPFGAVPSETEVQFNINALPGIQKATLVIEKRRLTGNQEQLDYQTLTRVSMQAAPASNALNAPAAPGTSIAPDANAQVQWHAAYRFSEPAVYGYYFELLIDDQLFIYQNNKDSVYWTREKGSMGLGSVDEAPERSAAIRRFRQTVYRPDFKVPEWARDAVYYFIFPERFRNGDRSNDPQPGVSRYHDKTVEFHRNWLERPAKPGTGDGYDEVYNNDFFGGDLAGIIEKLDYIKALGANTIYMTPIFRAASNHKYDTADYKQIDPGFGTNADFERLTQEAARRGIRVIPDASLNHTGADSKYFDRYGNFGGTLGAFAGGKINPTSPYADWYRFDASQTEPDKQFTGWIGVTDLPELNKNSSSFRQFAYGDPDSVMKFWLDKGAAGWRMDVAPWVPDDFWREWRTAVKHHKPDALTIAETWFDASKFFLGDTFDSSMNYILRNTLLDYAAGGDARRLYPNIELMREAYPAQSFFALMNLLSSHDTARALHHLGYNDDGNEAALALAKQRLRLATFFQMTFPGAPAIYYGDEVGVAGGEDPYNRATYPWADQGGKPDLDLLNDFKRMAALRQHYAVLRHGSLDAPAYLDAHLVALVRRDGDAWAITVSNNDAVARQLRLPLPKGVDRAQAWFDGLTGAAVPTHNGFFELTVPPHFGVVLLTR